VVGDRAGTINLGLSKSQKTGYGNDKISGFENVTGGVGNDRFTGDAAANKLDGGDGNDSLDGGDGDDVLIGGAGIDQLTGGKGNDVFQFLAEHSGASAATMDVIADFEIGKDKIDLSAIDLDAVTDGVQHFASTDFKSGEGAGVFTKAGQLYFDTKSGILYATVHSTTSADFAIQLKGAGLGALASGDFIL
jgi:Ca2+-binding RTX toxin-like protein